jgi:Circularly permuted ATP-grasp type 2
MDAIAEWHDLLSPDRELTPEYCAAFAASMRERKLTFGDRVHCPVLRPFFLSASDEARIRTASETLAAIGERVVAEAQNDPGLLAALGVNEAEERLVRINPGYRTASTASRLDAFLLPDSLYFAEYNAESPAGPAYTQRLCELFDELAPMQRFKAGRAVAFHRTIPALLSALLESYKEWGGGASPPTIAIVDWREVPTWTEFELLRDAFTAVGVPTVVSDPRDLTFDGGVLHASGVRIDLVYRRVLINDLIARPDECAALLQAYEQRAVCVANTLRCKLPHKKAFFALLTDAGFSRLMSDAERAIVRAHVPWTRLVADTSTDWQGRRAPMLEIARREREELVLKPNDEYGGKGVMLGWETPPGKWDRALSAALADAPGTWVIQQRIPVRREVFPYFDDAGRVTMRDMLVDLAPYLFRGRMAGYLARLSETGLANVTSGGGQVPAFVIGS